MSSDEEIGSHEGSPAGDEESGKHPANDPAPGETGELGAGRFRDREARLAMEIGADTNGEPKENGTD